MKTVQDYLDLGLVFVGGDKICGITGDSSSRKLNIFDRSICSKQYNKGAVKIGADCYARARWTPSSFAWRNNDGVKPEYNGVVEVCLNNAIELSSTRADWSLWERGYLNSVAKWRPVVMQSESPTVSTKEDKSMKPVYTAEMHAKGEPPPVGAECILIVNDEPRLAKVTYIGKDIVCCSNVDGDAEYACLLGLVSFEPIPKTIKVNGFYVPAPMSEAPMIGDEYYTPQTGYEVFYCKNSWRGDKFDSRFLSRGLVHSTESAAIAHAKAMLGINPNPARGGDGYDRNVLGKNNEGDEI